MTTSLIALLLLASGPSGAQTVESTIEESTHANCGGKAMVASRNGDPVDTATLDECDMGISFLAHGDLAGTAVSVRRITIKDFRTGEQVYQADRVSGTATFRQIEFSEWSRNAKPGSIYTLSVVYLKKARDGGEEDEYPVLFRFKRGYKEHGFLLTGKVFTGWKFASGQASDQFFLLPGVAFGYGWRLSGDPRDVIALRAVASAGPNLIPSDSVASTSTDPASGAVTTTATKANKFEAVIGAELSLGRYISLGVAWTLRDRTSIPLLLVTYGDLYPALGT